MAGRAFLHYVDLGINAANRKAGALGAPAFLQLLPVGLRCLVLLRFLLFFLTIVPFCHMNGLKFVDINCPKLNSNGTGLYFHWSQSEYITNLV
jgi:hypothetical protein